MLVFMYGKSKIAHNRLYCARFLPFLSVINKDKRIFYYYFQVVSNRDTQETLLCTAYVFEVSTSEHGAQHHIYRLVKDQQVIGLTITYHFSAYTLTILVLLSVTYFLRSTQLKKDNVKKCHFEVFESYLEFSDIIPIKSEEFSYSRTRFGFARVFLSRFYIVEGMLVIFYVGLLKSQKFIRFYPFLSICGI